MKVIKAALIIGVSLAVAGAQAYPHGHHHGGHYGGHYGHGHGHGHGHHNDGLSDGEALLIGAAAGAVVGAAAMSCSPDAMVKNTKTLDAKLTSFSENEFKDNAVFTQKVADMKAMSAAQKVDEAFRMVGIDNPRNAKEIMEVVYAREPSKKSVERVSDNLKLSEKESRMFIQSVTSALRQR